MKQIEYLILAHLIHTPEFGGRVGPHLEDKLFQYPETKFLYRCIRDFSDKYKSRPTFDALEVIVNSARGTDHELIEPTTKTLHKIFSESFIESVRKQTLEWVFDTVQKYLTDRACYLAIMESLAILDPEESKKNKKKPDMIPELLRKALSINFDPEIGHNYITDAEARYEAYNSTTSKIPFSLSMLNMVTDGGMPEGSLFLMSAATGMGKSLFLVDQAAHWVKAGYDVLYVTLEMSEIKISERVDANILDCEISKVKNMAKSTFLDKMKKLREGGAGTLRVKQYAPGSFHSNHLRSLLDELKRKDNFIPKIIIVDYLGIMASYRVKAEMGSYTLMKFIAEELRGVAVDYKACVYSATQVNRGGVNNSDPDLTNMADSMGIAHTADVIMIMAGTPELEAINAVRIIQAKNRYGSLQPASFLIGIERSKMKLVDSDVPPEKFGGSTGPSKPSTGPSGSGPTQAATKIVLPQVDASASKHKKLKYEPVEEDIDPPFDLD